MLALRKVLHLQSRCTSNYKNQRIYRIRREHQYPTSIETAAIYFKFFVKLQQFKPLYNAISEIFTTTFNSDYGSRRTSQMFNTKCRRWSVGGDGFASTHCSDRRSCVVISIQITRFMDVGGSLLSEILSFTRCIIHDVFSSALSVLLRLRFDCDKSTVCAL